MRFGDKELNSSEGSWNGFQLATPSGSICLIWASPRGTKVVSIVSGDDPQPKSCSIYKKILLVDTHLPSFSSSVKTLPCKTQHTRIKLCAVRNSP